MNRAADSNFRAIDWGSRALTLPRRRFECPLSDPIRNPTSRGSENANQARVRRKARAGYDRESNHGTVDSAESERTHVESPTFTPDYREAGIPRKREFHIQKHPFGFDRFQVREDLTNNDFPNLDSMTHAIQGLQYFRVILNQIVRSSKST